MTEKTDTGQKQCVICESKEHDGEGWIYHTSDTELVDIRPGGVERELKDDARPICSIECKDEFEATRLD